MRLKFERNPKNDLRSIFRDELIYRNSVVVGAVGMCPVVAVSFTLYNALYLSILMAILMIPTCLFSALFLRNIPRWVRIPILCLVSSVMYCVAMLLKSQFPADLFTTIEPYAPILVVSSVLLTHAEQCTEEENFWRSLAHTLGGVLGFALIAGLSGIGRELLTFGTVGGHRIFQKYPTVSAISMPFFGMIVIGYIGAIFKKLRMDRESKEAKRHKRTGGAV